jgi:hypothetical protein
MQPTLIDCPKCGTPIALLPSDLYSTAGIDPGEITESGKRDAVFAILEPDGRYTCPACNTPGTIGL